MSSAENVADPPAYQMEIKCSVCLKKVSSLKLLFCLPFHSHRGVIVSFPMDDSHFQSRKKKEILFEELCLAVFTLFFIVFKW